MKKIFTLLLIYLFNPLSSLAGDLDSSALPDDNASAMYSLEYIYNRLYSGAAGGKRTNGFREPTSGPSSTGHSIDEVMVVAPSVQNTDGAFPREVVAGKSFWSLRTDGTWGTTTGTWDGSPICTGTLYGSRWCDNLDGTVLDLSTGLVWLKNGNCWGKLNWDSAVVKPINELRSGVCGLDGDGSVWGDWRLPTFNELDGLANGVDPVRVLTPGAFEGIIDESSTPYWTSVSQDVLPLEARIVYLGNGQNSSAAKSSLLLYVIAVRDWK